MSDMFLNMLNFRTNYFYNLNYLLLLLDTIIGCLLIPDD